MIDTKITIPIGFYIGVGKILIIAGQCVTIPVIILSLLAVTGHGLDKDTVRLLLIISSIGFAIVGTSGGAFVGRQVFTYEKHRKQLGIAWLLQLCGVVAIGSIYLMMLIDEEKTLDGILPYFWMRVVYAIVIIATPEIGIVASMVCVGDLAESSDEINLLEERLEEESLKASRSNKALEDLRESMEQEVQEKVKGYLDESLKSVAETLGKS